ncbi:hypothetical protein Tco_1567835 [Tanacetum coccineum]
MTGGGHEFESHLPLAGVISSTATWPTQVVPLVDWWSGGGSRWSATIDRRWPPLTATIHHRWQPLTGGSGDGVETAGRPRGTTQVVTRGVLIISAGVTGSGYEAAGLEVGSGGSEIGSGGSVASLDTPANNGIFWKHTCHSAIGGSWYK